MRYLLRNTVIYSLTLFLLPEAFPGIKVEGGFPLLVLAGFVLTILYLIVKPILNIISFPINLITLGLFSFFTNVIILYLLTVFVPNVIVSGFTFSGWSFAGFSLPKTNLGIFEAYVVIGLSLAFFSDIFRWMVK